jgi:sialidase-1
MLLTRAGTLIVYNESRRTAEDWAMMDILYQRSTDGGESFSPFAPLANGSEAHPTVNNPVMMQGQDGVIHFLYCEDYSTNGGRVLHRTSSDDGVSWSEPVDITRFTAPEERSCFALGPGHGICMADGTLLVPVWLVPNCYGVPTRKHAPSVIAAAKRLSDVLQATDAHA